MAAPSVISSLAANSAPTVKVLTISARQLSLRFDQRKKLVARLFVLAECAEHGAGDGARMLLLDATHHHAEMLRFGDDSDADGIQEVLNALRDFLSHALLNLQPPRESVDDARQLAQPDHFVFRDIR